MQQVFVLAVGRLPDGKRHPLKRRRCELSLNSTPGVIDWCEIKEYGTLLFFGTLPHAEKAMKAMKDSGNPVSDRIMTAEADYETHTFKIKGAVGS